MAQTKQQREVKKQMQLFKLSVKLPLINKTLEKAQPFVSKYYEILRREWTHKIDSCYDPFDLAELKKNKELKLLNKQFNFLLKNND